MSTLLAGSLSALAYAAVNGGKLVHDKVTVQLSYVTKLVCKLLAELVFTRTVTPYFLNALPASVRLMRIVCGKMQVKLYALRQHSEMGTSGQLHAPAAFASGDSPSSPSAVLCNGSGRLQGRCGRWVTPPSARNRTPVPHPVGTD